jgi:sialate O-acetylesterase
LLFDMACLLFAKTSLLLLALCIIESHGDLRFANYYQDHMVLQRGPQRAVVWGYGAASAVTILRMNNKVYRTFSGANPVNRLGESIWSVTLDAETQEGPFEVLVTQPVANGTLVSIGLKDVLYGDVWFCSGQSNMQMAVYDNFNAAEEIAAAANYPKIRLFTNELRSTPNPVEEPIEIVQNWSVASPSSVGGPSYSYASALCWHYGRLIHTGLNGRPIGLVASSWGGTPIEVWMPPQALIDCGITTNGTMALESYGQPRFQPISLVNSELYNSMVYPFTRMVITGAIWYQGESNAYVNREKYSCSFSKMIQTWRQAWNTRTGGNTAVDFPFGFVQLSTNEPSGAWIGGFPWIRLHQTFDVGYVPNEVVPNVFMAVAIDLRDDGGQVHPRNKADVGYRLSRAGLAVAYGQQVEYRGPIVSQVVVSSDSRTIDITYTAVTAIAMRFPLGFEVCCQGAECANEYIWEAASALPKDSLTITLTLPDSCVSKPVYGLRYLWRETPCPTKLAAVYSATDPNLPSPPYIKIF